MGKLSSIEKFEELEKKQQPKEKKDVVKKISSKTKTKMISAKVNAEKYAQFHMINRKIGVSNNSVINMLINNYIKENIAELEE